MQLHRCGIIYVCIYEYRDVCRETVESQSESSSKGSTYHCVNSGAFLVLGHLKSSWCTAGRGTGWKSEEHCLHSLLTLEPLPFASRCNSTSNGPADSARFDTRCHKTCKEIYPLRAKTQGHISCCPFGTSPE